MATKNVSMTLDANTQTTAAISTVTVTGTNVYGHTMGQTTVVRQLGATITYELVVTPSSASMLIMEQHNLLPLIIR